jgi:hypothetical protein
MAIIKPRPQGHPAPPPAPLPKHLALRCPACVERTITPIGYNIPANIRWEWSEESWTDADMMFEHISGKRRHMFLIDAAFPVCAPWWDTGIEPPDQPETREELAAERRALRLAVTPHQRMRRAQVATARRRRAQSMPPLPPMPRAGQWDERCRATSVCRTWQRIGFQFSRDREFDPRNFFPANFFNFCH